MLSRREANLKLSDDLAVSVFTPVDKVHLIHANHDVLDAEKIRNEGVATGLLNDTFTRINKKDGEVAVDAPVTILRVYWMRPGVSAMMNLRFGVAK